MECIIQSPCAYICCDFDVALALALTSWQIMEPQVIYPPPSSPRLPSLFQDTYCKDPSLFPSSIHTCPYLLIPTPSFNVSTTAKIAQHYDLNPTI